MEELTSLALDIAKSGGAEYADIRFCDRQSESTGIKNGVVEEFVKRADRGFGVRAIVDGAWGFASSSLIERTEVEKVARLAIEIARASATAKHKSVELAPVPAVRDRYRTELEKDPLTVSIEDRLALLSEADELIRKTRGVNISRASMEMFKNWQVFASSEGSFIEQETTQCGAAIQAMAIEGGEVQQRSYPTSHGGNFAAAGYEFIEGLRLKDHASRIAEEAVQLLSAEPCPSGETTLILEASQLALQVHESIGHPSELDRVLGMEASFAGTSYMTLDRVGTYRLGAPIVNISADATLPKALGTFGYDDEGVPAQRTDIVKEGIFSGYLSSRETALAIGRQSNGCMRADGWNRIPLVRMTNVSLAPGDSSLEQMIAETKEGLYLVSNRSWSIDDRRLNFQFATEIGWKIKDGALGGPVKNANYTGITPVFWQSCDAIAGPAEWQVWGLTNCGKGEPMQIARVAHGAAPARFRNVKVGVGR